MTATEWREVEALFERALEMPNAERPRLLDSIADEATRAEVESLLAAHAESFLEERDRFLPSEAFEPATFPSGHIVDRYRIIREIGRGGMGAVFLAERADDQYRKRVALKLIKRGMDTESVLRRFRDERQILAGFDHPNIAQLFDGGETESGLPYFVMEYVEGLPIDEFCIAHSLTIPKRLRLFREVCAAVSYAHGHLVIHRDIKTSNILVTAEGVPKLLDFGIAKILHQSGAESPATLTAVRPMTPEYASPEQLRGAAVTTASDVYSLGVILYQLLTGESPYRSGPSADDFGTVVNEIQTRKPSTVVAKASRPIGVISDANSLRGDLDNIVLMALRGEPERRFRSVEQFSEDIRRHLENLPVRARRDTIGYRSAKFIRRNKAALAAGSLVSLSLIGGIVATARQAQIARVETARAERRFNDVRKLANSVLFDYHDAIKSLPGATKVRERLVRDALSYLDSLASEAYGDPALQRELAAAYERVGDVLGGQSIGSLGDIAGAIASYTKARTIREALLASRPSDGQTRRDLASSLQKIGTALLDTGEASKGLEDIRIALTIHLGLTQDQPDDEDLQLELVSDYNVYGRALSLRNDYSGALEQHRRALSICEQVLGHQYESAKFRRARWSTYEHIAHALYLQNDVDGAIAMNSRALEVGEALIATEPANADYRRALVLNYRDGGDYRKRSDKAAALVYFRKAVALDEELLKQDPANGLTRKDLGYLYKRTADFFANAKDFAQAYFYFDNACETYKKVVADAPADIICQFLISSCRAGKASMQAQQGEIEAALEECRAAMSHLGEINEDPNNVRQRSNRAQAYEYLGYAYSALANSPRSSANERIERMTTARDMFREGFQIADEIHRQDVTPSADALWVKELAGEIAKCEAALAAK